MRIAGCALLVFVSGLAVGAEVYRSTSPDGIVSYSDRPLSADSETVFIATVRSGVAPATRTAAAANLPAEGAAPAAAATPPVAESDGPTLAELRAQRAKNCTIARERQERYSISHRLYRELPNGDREYLSDTDVEEARSRAAADVETWCD